MINKLFKLISRQVLGLLEISGKKVEFIAVEREVLFHPRYIGVALGFNMLALDI